MVSMKVEFTKGNGLEQPTVVKCSRSADVAIFWPIHDYLVQHDLAHFAVEQALGYENGFWGLIDKGWNVEMFIGRMPKPPTDSVLPLEAYYAEIIVGALQSDYNCTPRSDGTILSILFDECLSCGLPMPDLCIDDIKRARFELTQHLEDWKMIPKGGVFQLDFQPYTTSR